MYFLNYVDRNAIAQARLNDLEEDLGMTGSDFNTAVSMYDPSRCCKACHLLTTATVSSSDTFSCKFRVTCSSRVSSLVST